ncbi:NUDIX domain-containing protein [Nocardioides jejuensis]|nr:NUDIX domain-containing protein [Nocardioides jejuensis]
MYRTVNILLVNAAGQLLLQERDEHAPRCPDQWGAPGGHVEPGETHEEAAYRELAEETGVSLPPGALTLWRDEVFAYAEEERVAHYQLWIGRADLTDRDVVCNEGRQMTFVDPDRVSTLDLWESARHFLPSFLASADYRALAVDRVFASIAVVDPRGWILMQERDEFPELDPEKWGLPGGHVEAGEQPLAAAYRELMEETGLAPDGPLQEVTVALVQHRPGRLDAVHLYAAATAATDADVVCGEGRQMVFVDPAAALDLDLTTGATALLPGFVGSASHRALTTPPQG